ncbi:MAG: hypothetical protein AAF790_10325, partial [Planctomycetota bacterium]
MATPADGTADDRRWTLDQLGNWEEVHHNTPGAGAAAQTRTHSDANEVETVSGWSNPACDAAGNMT